MPSGREIEVISLCCYLTSTEPDWRPIDHTTSKMVKTLKGDQIKGYFERKFGRYDNENKHHYLPKIHAAMSIALAAEVSGPADLVPIPNSHVVDPSTSDFKTLILATAIAEHSTGQFRANPLLVFRRAQQKTRGGGGSRNPSTIQVEYVVTGRTTRPIVLIDDVLTSGGHIIAACRVIEDAGMSLPIKAITFGRSIREQLEKPVMVHRTVHDVDPMRSF